MASSTLVEVLDSLRKLKAQDQQKALAVLRSLLSSTPINATQLTHDVREGRTKKGQLCPYCRSPNVVRFGYFKGKPLRQRYRCKECKKTFSDFTCTPLRGTHYPDLWILFAKCMIAGLTLRLAAKQIGVTHVTLFYWRHKILKPLQQLDVAGFEGIVEAGETFFLHSQKGSRRIVGREPRKSGGVAALRGVGKKQVCVLVVRDRQDQTLSRNVGFGKIGKKPVAEVIGKRVKAGNILCTDGETAYKSCFESRKEVVHIRLVTDKKKGQAKDGIYHLQNVSAYRSGLKQWIARFHGVSTKYLQNYLDWFRFVSGKGDEPMTQQQMEILVTSCLYETRETYWSLRIAEAV